jgi:hypothetical protein
MDNTSDNEQSDTGWDDLYTIQTQTSNPALKHAIQKLDVGRPVDYTPEIGAFICSLISEGKTVQNVIDAYNEIVPETKLTRSKIYSWLKNIKLTTFQNWYAYARELSTNGILDDIIDLENDIISDAVSFKSGRVVLESKRWRAKVQNPDYFNPVQKTEEDHKHEIVIKASIPVPLPLPGHLQAGEGRLQVGGTDDEDVIDVDPEPDASAEDGGATASE